jgi:hypothetical protein
MGAAGDADRQLDVAAGRLRRVLHVNPDQVREHASPEAAL